MLEIHQLGSILKQQGGMNRRLWLAYVSALASLPVVDTVHARVLLSAP